MAYGINVNMQFTDNEAIKDSDTFDVVNVVTTTMPVRMGTYHAR
jgi:hypothetical protein